MDLDDIRAQLKIKRDRLYSWLTIPGAERDPRFRFVSDECRLVNRIVDEVVHGRGLVLEPREHARVIDRYNLFVIYVNKHGYAPSREMGDLWMNASTAVDRAIVASAAAYRKEMANY